MQRCIEAMKQEDPRLQNYLFSQSGCHSLDTPRAEIHIRREFNNLTNDKRMRATVAPAP